MLKNRLKKVFYVVIILSILLNNPIQNYYAQTPGEDILFSSGASLSLLSIYNLYAAKAGNTEIIYILDGGINNPKNIKCLTDNNQSLKLIAAHKYGYIFSGWYLDPHFTKKVSKINYQGGCALYLFAKWSRKYDSKYSVENYEYKNDKKIKSNTMVLKDCNYSFNENINIPGMPETKEDDLFNNLIFSTAQCPQGICYTDDYVLITSYSEEDDCLGEMMVFDKLSGQYLITLGMDPKSHLGGIAYDGKNVWVCNSNDKTIERISYDFIKVMADENKGEVVDATEVVDIYPVRNTPSCITFYNDRLWVATHHKIFDAKMVAYYFDEDENTLSKLSSYTIPAQVQGIAFNSDGNIFLSTSYGRSLSSYIKQYSSVVTLSSKPNKPDGVIEMPPCSEEIDYKNGSLYVIFESAAEKYFEGTDGNGVSDYPIDKILEIKL